VLAALPVAWVWWSKDWVVIDPERIRWPLRRSELRWDDVGTSKIVRVLGMEYARVQRKGGRVKWIALNRVGGQEYRARVLAKLGLA